MKIWMAFLLTLVMIGCEVTEGPKQNIKREFVPPEDGKITSQMASAYIDASRYLLEEIKKHEKSIIEFAEIHNLSQDLSELADSEYRESHGDIVRAWDQLVSSWKEVEDNAYKKANITEEEFNWIGGALTDPINKDVQDRVAKELSGE